MSQLQSNGGFGGVDGLHRIGRISEGVMTASGLVFISELMVRTSKRLVRDCEGVVLVLVCDEEIEKNKIPMHIRTINCCCLQGCSSKSE